MTCDDLTCFLTIPASITTIPTTQKSSDTDDKSITVAKEIEIPIEVEKSNKPLNGEEVNFLCFKKSEKGLVFCVVHNCHHNCGPKG